MKLKELCISIYAMCVALLNPKPACILRQTVGEVRKVNLDMAFGHVVHVHQTRYVHTSSQRKAQVDALFGLDKAKARQ